MISLFPFAKRQASLFNRSIVVPVLLLPCDCHLYCPPLSPSSLLLPSCSICSPTVDPIHLLRQCSSHPEDISLLYQAASATFAIALFPFSCREHCWLHDAVNFYRSNLSLLSLSQRHHLSYCCYSHPSPPTAHAAVVPLLLPSSPPAPVASLPLLLLSSTPTPLLPLPSTVISSPLLQSHDLLPLSFPYASTKDNVVALPFRANVAGVSSQQQQSLPSSSSLLSYPYHCRCSPLTAPYVSSSFLVPHHHYRSLHCYCPLSTLTPSTFSRSSLGPLPRHHSCLLPNDRSSRIALSSAAQQ
ncbi:hypothetical protein B296_00025614 [Ensete ventricosum]|uniref:Uncharacterized protein n=1 Tax=Ensete ventricosum TaxID=4639 RepID=A0A427ASP0_ENSVE|nr:hypothetical protein B296_00025614 [Ensete ventricosum]